MKASDIDWAYLRGASRWVLAAALCCAVMVGLSGYYLREQRLEFERLSSERDAVREDYLAAESQGRVTDEYHARYLTLRRSGVVGAERRLDWVEAVPKQPDSGFDRIVVGLRDGLPADMSGVLSRRSS